MRSRPGEHGEFVSCIRTLIDVLPLACRAVITEVDENTVNPNLVQGKYLFRLEARTLQMTFGRWASTTPRMAI